MIDILGLVALLSDATKHIEKVKFRAFYTMQESNKGKAPSPSLEKVPLRKPWITERPTS
ncbi:hypothetical protein MRX58_12775 (plasmid) [Xylella fastidiosa subsp. pauca]|uniref:hypothetical protein n=1 Tax=Xylella fastidiosa TaxID=2371 RepID=UPI00241CCD83|nr:hypothetical protein [Xylella fastidiosa]MDG5824387.1 hypothetical protein [Xylella fastidiosa subsp. pauca]